MPTTNLDLVQNVMDRKPLDFSTNFAELVTDRLKSMVADKRKEVATSLFVPLQPVEDQIETTPEVANDELTPETEDENNAEKVA